MDNKFAFEIHANGVQLLTDPGRELEGSASADVLFLRPDLSPQECRALLKTVRPRLVIPVHWESLHQPLSKPLRPAWRPPRWKFPFVGRFDLNRLKEVIQSSDPAIEMFVPDVLHLYTLQEATVSLRTLRRRTFPRGAGASCASKINLTPTGR